MKKVLIIIASILLLGAASCQKEAPANDEMQEVTFTVSLPSEIETKSISDGEKATVLYYATYTKAGKYLPSLSNDTTEGLAPTSTKTFKVTLKLVKGIEYDVVFWAQSPDCKAFTFNWNSTTPTVTVSYSGNANDDARDAFYRMKSIKVPFENEEDKTIKLYRPFAQINFGASDYQSVVDYYSETEVDKGMTSGLTIGAEVPSVMNLLTGNTSSPVSAEFALNAIPSGEDKTLTINNTGYRYVSMNYVLARSGNTDTPDTFNSITGKFVLTINNDEKLERDVTVTSVPYLRNHRTNIVGNFFTENAELTVVIDQNFNKPDLQPKDGSITIK